MRQEVKLFQGGLFLALIVSLGLAQAQPPQKTAPDDSGAPTPTPESSALSPRGVSTITGTGTAGRIPVFTGTYAIGNSVITQYSSKIGIGTVTPKFPLTVVDTSNTAIEGSGLNIGVYGIGTSASGLGLYGFHTATTGTNAGVRGDTNSTDANAVGVLGTVNSKSPGGSSAAVRGINNGISSSGIGVYGSQNGSGYGVYGVASNGDGVVGSGYTGVYGTGSGYGVYGSGSYGVYGSGGTYGVYGSGTYGVYGSGTYGVYASGSSYGVYAVSSSGFGVQGTSTSSVGVAGNSGSSNALQGVSDTGIGLYAESTSSAGVDGVSHSSNGVQGISTSGTGVLGQSSSGNAGYFIGNVGITGTLTKGAGSFKIDHPLDPAHKYLSHSFVESPDMKNIYDGTITTDGHGEAIVALPSYFSALNKDFRYQLTCIGTFAQAIIAEEIKNNRFTIKTDKPHVKVSWQVTGIRHDAYADAHRIKVEEDKQGKERGAYLHPELFGQPKNKGIGYAMTAEMGTRAAARVAGH